MNFKHIVASFGLSIAALMPIWGHAQTTYSENFTGSATTNSWYFFNGACLTAKTTPATANPGALPGCTSLSYYSSKGDASQVGGDTGTLPDTPALGGALRFTNGRPGGYNENGAIVSNFTFPASNGLQVTFTTETYEGNSGGSGADGADGMSFFLQSVDQGQTPDLGAFGGSLGYTCSNSNNDGTLRANGQPRGYDGLTGGYIGLGIDEYGNFLNAGDNTSTSASSGNAFQWNRIGLRGAGSTAWAYLNATYPAQYPSTLSYAQRAAAVQNTCRTGFVWDYSSSPFQTTTKIPNYAAIPGAFKVLSGVKIANEAATLRGSGASTSTTYGVPITYNLKIVRSGTQNLLSFSYSYNGGVYQPVITGQDISVANGQLPNNVRFGFAGSSGGSTNIHEIMCFQAAPIDQTASSAGVNQKQSAKVQIGSQVYFAFYNTQNWQGSVTSQNLVLNSSGVLEFANYANWDASCVLTGVLSGAVCATTNVSGLTNPEGSSNRVILSYDGTTGIPFEWTNLSSAEKTAVDTGDSTVTADRLNYMRGDRTNELNALGVGEFRARDDVLGDIIDSSPTWVGPPAAGFSDTWTDFLTGASMPENSGGAQKYSVFTTAGKQRTNVVYVGANDGMLHGFRSGAYSSTGVYDATYNDGNEVLAYVPAYVVNSINANANTALNYSNFQYAHRFYVDATPGEGDLFYGNKWHSWLVGGLGAGGSAIYALDVTDPTKYTESPSNAASVVIGEWNPTTITCQNVASCGASLGKTFGVPQIRRFHNGRWGAVFGNGFGSTSGDAGIYVMLADPSSGAPTFYYLSTHQTAGAGDGIAYVATADLDGDSTVDYVYAGDLLGNVWKFDLTDPNPTNWAAIVPAIFTTVGSQPISTQIQVVGINSVVNGATRLMLEFGTGRSTPVQLNQPATYSTTVQALYGIWDWTLGSWNSKSSTKYNALPSGTVAAPSSALSTSNLQQQSITYTVGADLSSAGNQYRTVTNNSVCYADASGCTGTKARYGWYMQLPVGPADPSNSNSPTVAEQVTFNPAVLSGVFVVNTTVPPTNTPQTCSSTSASAWLMSLDPQTGGALPQPYFLNGTTFAPLFASTAIGTVAVSAIANAGLGSPSEVLVSATGSGSASSQASNYLILSPNQQTPTNGAGPSPPNCTATGCGAPIPEHPPSNTSIKRVTWIEKR